MELKDMENIDENQLDESLPGSPGLHPINISTQYKELFSLDKQIAEESDGLLLPLTSAETLKKFLTEEHNSNNVILNDEDGNHAGYFSYYDVNPETSELLNIGVLKEFRGKGFAHTMMQRYFDLNIDKSKFVLVTKPENLQAIRFYEKLGYTISALKKDYYGPGEDRVFLEFDKKTAS